MDIAFQTSVIGLLLVSFEQRLLRPNSLVAQALLSFLWQAVFESQLSGSSHGCVGWLSSTVNENAFESSDRFGP